MGYTIPNIGDAAFQPQAEPDSGDFEVLAAAFNGSFVASGCLVDQATSPNMSIDVASGVVSVDGARVAVTGGNTSVTAANGTNPRIDLVTINSSGTTVVTAGTAAATPVYPSIPAASVVLAAVYVPAADTAITDNQIIDKRVLRPFEAVEYTLVVGGEADNISATTDIFSWRAPKDFYLTSVAASVGTAPTGTAAIFDINVAAATILSTKITIDVTEDYSGDAGTPPVISTPAISEGDLVTVDADQVGSGTPGAGLKIYLIGTAG